MNSESGPPPRSPRRDRPRLIWKACGETDIGGSRENQDDMFIFERVDLGICVIGVLDGHGRDVGQLAANSARKFLLDYFAEKCQDLLTDPYSCLVEGIRCCHEYIRESFMESLRKKGWEVQNTGENYLVKRKSPNAPWACVHGGTSCSIIAIVNGMLYAANVGDSSGILCTSHPVMQQSMMRLVGDAADDSKTAALLVPDGPPVDTVVLTAEHSPECPEEFLRMRKFRAREGDSSQPSLLVVYDASTHDKSRCSNVFAIDPTGKPVVTNRGTYYKNVRKEWASLVAAPSYARFQDALAFTRSLGDFHLHAYGVSEHPEVQCIDLHQVFQRMKESDAYSDPSKPPTVAVVLASDGIWDNWTYEDVTAFVVNPDLRHVSDSGGKSDDDCDDRGEQLRHTKAVSKALIDSNAVHANRNFGNQADNATGIVLLLHCEDCTR